jgi:hypothetical protein
LRRSADDDAAQRANDHGSVALRDDTPPAKPTVNGGVPHR